MHRSALLRQSASFFVLLAPLIVALALRGATTTLSESIVLALAALAALTLTRRVGRRSIVAAAPFAVLAGWLALTRAWALLPGSAQTGAGIWAAFALTILATHGLCRHNVRWRAALLLGVTAAVSAVPVGTAIDIVEHTITGSSIAGVRLAGWLGYWNATAICGAWSALAALTLLRSRVRTRTPIALTAGSLLLACTALTLAATASRGALAALAIAIIVFIVLSRGQVIRTIAAAIVVVAATAGAIAWPSFTTSWGVIALLLGIAAASFLLITLAARIEALDVSPAAQRAANIVVALIIIVIFAALAPRARQAAHNFRNDNSFAATTNAGRLTTASSDSRWVWWNEATAAWHKHLVAGQGSGAFGAIHLRHRSDSSTVDDPHQIVLAMGVDGGIIAALLWLGGIVIFVIHAWRARGAPWTPLAAALASLVPVQSLADWTWSVPALLMAWAIAAAVATSGPPCTRVRKLHRSRLAALLILSALAVVPFAAAGTLNWAQYDVSHNKLAPAQTLSAISFALAPAPQTLATKVSTVEAAHGTVRAQTTLLAGLKPLSKSSDAWWIALDSANRWQDVKLAARAQGNLARLDPIGAQRGY